MITPLQANEWALFRQLRLAALAESPDASSPTLESVEDRDEHYWQDAATRFAESEQMVLLVARPDLGLMSAVADEQMVGHIGAMWVAPGARGQQLGNVMLDTGIQFLEGIGCLTIELSVTETNTVAIALYRSRGFELTGVDEPLREGSPLRNLFMARTRR